MSKLFNLKKKIIWRKHQPIALKFRHFLRQMEQKYFLIFHNIIVFCTKNYAFSFFSVLVYVQLGKSNKVTSKIAYSNAKIN